MSHDPKLSLAELETETTPTRVEPLLNEPVVVDRTERIQSALETQTDQNKVQFLPRFEEYLGGATFDAQTGRYAEVSPERKAEIEKDLGELGELMAGADFGWWLDGAINVSLYQEDGNFIRDHKDVDMSISVDNLPALEKQLYARGSAIVYVDRDRYTETERCLEIVSADEIKERNLGKLQIVRLNADGKISSNSDQLNFIDLHVLQRGADGSVTIPYSGVTFPKEYFETNHTHVAKNGRSIHLSHPAIVAYHKVESGRDYDFSDITLMRGMLSDADVRMLENIFQKEPERILERYSPVIKNAFDQLNPEMSDAEIISVLEQTGISQDPDAAAFIKNFPRYLHTHSEMTSEDFMQALFAEIKVTEKLGKRAQSKIDKLHKALGR